MKVNNLLFCWFNFSEDCIRIELVAFSYDRHPEEKKYIYLWLTLQIERLLYYSTDNRFLLLCLNDSYVSQWINKSIVFEVECIWDIIEVLLCDTLGFFLIICQNNVDKLWQWKICCLLLINRKKDDFYLFQVHYWSNFFNIINGRLLNFSMKIIQNLGMNVKYYYDQ